MGQAHILPELLIVLGFCLAVVFLFHKIRFPILVAFLLTGILIGPGGLALVTKTDVIHSLAEVGVSLLLFTIGLKFSLTDLIGMKRFIVGAGALQLLLTTMVLVFVLQFFSLPLAQSIILGVLLSMSSTAIVMRLLDERAENTSLHGRFMTGILVFQDLAIVPFTLLIPFLGRLQIGGVPWTVIGLSFAKTLIAMMVILTAAHYFLPWLIEKVVQIQSRELFTLSIVFISMGMAFASGRVGLSLPLGAFLAGLLLAGSIYSQQIISDITPFKDVFNSLFFISVGMLVMPAVWIKAPLLLLGMIAIVFVIKAILVALVAKIFGLGNRIATLAGLGLAQVGEFAFVMAEQAGQHELFTGDNYQYFLTVSVASMVITPFVLRLTPVVVRRTRDIPGLEKKQGSSEAAVSLQDHVIIVGYGVNGRNVARVLKKIKVSYVILELNAYTVKAHKESSEPLYYGDATHPQVLRAAGIKKARALVVAIAEPLASRQIVAQAHAAKPHLSIIVRTRFISEMDELYRLGAKQVIPEEFETSLELATQVLRLYQTPPEFIEQEKAAIRAERYDLLREPV